MSRQGSRRSTRQFKSTTTLLTNPTRTKYLKTLGEDLVTRAELALRLVNDYQTRKQHIDFPMGSKVFAPVNEDNSKGIHTNLQEGISEKINIIGEGTRELYRMDCRDKSFPIRLQFRNVRNTIRIYGSFKERYPSEGEHEFQFDIGKDSRHSVKPRNEKYQDFLYLTLEALSHIGIMDMKLNFYDDHLQKIRQGYKMRNGKVIMSPIRTEHAAKEHDESVEEEEARFILPLLATTREKPSKSSSTKHFNRLGHSTSRLASNKQLPSLEKEKDAKRAVDAKQRRQQLADLKVKERELIQKAAQSKEIIQAYEKKLAYEADQRTKISQALAKVLMLNNLFSQIDLGAKNYVERFGVFAKVAMRQNRTAAKIKQFYQNAIAEISSRKARVTANIHEGVYFLAKFKHKNALTASTTIIKHLIEPFAICMRLNESFDQATVFRRKLRLVQKHWKAKYHERLSVIKQFAAAQVKKTLSAYPQFQHLQEQFVKTNQLTAICVEYIKDVAEKFNHLHAVYLQNLESIEQAKRTNEQIKDQNTRLLKKRQKPLLKIPDPPCRPFYRFFRDLDNLKAALRSWFEIEHRKQEKRARKKDIK